MHRHWPEQVLAWLLVVALLAGMLVGSRVIFHSPAGLGLAGAWLLAAAVAGWFDPPFSVAKERIMRRWGML